MTQGELKKLHNGLIKCPLAEVHKWMPEIEPIIKECPLPNEDYVVDAKVHMLMPNQFPCIPNWHGDACPRDADGNILMDECDEKYKMFLWLSNPPLTQFQDGRKILPRTWVEFTQADIHRGTISNGFCWRLFIRLMPTELVQRPRTGEMCLRRHSQVYLDSKNFTW